MSIKCHDHALSVVRWHWALRFTLVTIVLFSPSCNHLTCNFCHFIMNRYIDILKYQSVPDFAKPEEELQSSLQKLVNIFPPRSEYPPHILQGLWSGPTSIALLFHNLYLVKNEYEICGKKVSWWRDEYLNRRHQHGSVRPDKYGFESAHRDLPSRISRASHHILYSLCILTQYQLLHLWCSE